MRKQIHYRLCRSLCPRLQGKTFQIAIGHLKFAQKKNIENSQGFRRRVSNNGYLIKISKVLVTVLFVLICVFTFSSLRRGVGSKGSWAWVINFINNQVFSLVTSVYNMENSFTMLIRYLLLHISFIQGSKRR